MVESASITAIARSFGRAAASYDGASAIQQLAAQRLLQLLQTQQVNAQLALDLGCATAPSSRDLTQVFPCHWLGLDIALPMLQQACRQHRCHAHYLPVCADACRLPLADHSVDLVFSSFALQWTRPDVVLAELGRVLRPGAMLALSLPLAGSLAEIQAAWAQVDAEAHVNSLPDAPHWLAAANTQGLQVVEQAIWHSCEHAPDVPTQLGRIKATGAQHRLQQSSGFGARKRLAAFVAAYEQSRTAEGVPLSWRVLQLLLRKA